jgi:hypothetical protein
MWLMPRAVQGIKDIAKIYVKQPHKAEAGATNLSTKLAFELDLHGLVRCTSVVQNHKIEVEEAPKAAPKADADPKAVPKADTEMADASASVPGEMEAAAAENGDASNMDAEVVAPVDGDVANAPKPVKKVKKVSCEGSP